MWCHPCWMFYACTLVLSDSAVPNMDIFCSSLISCFRDRLCGYFLSDFRWFQLPLLLLASLLFLYFRIFSPSVLITLLSSEVSTSISIRVLFFVIPNYDVQFIVREGSVGVHLLIPWYGYLTFMTCFYQFWFLFIPVFIVQFHPYFLAYGKVQLSSHSIMSLYVHVLFYCRYWACWYNVGYCLVKLLT